MKILQPAGWPRPKGYSNAIEARGRQIFVSGLIGWNRQEQFDHADMAGQFEQILLSLIELLGEAQAGPEHVVRMTWYITDRSEYLQNAPRIGEIYRTIMGRNYPAMAVVQVVALMEEAARIEIEVTAVVPN